MACFDFVKVECGPVVDRVVLLYCVLLAAYSLLRLFPVNQNAKKLSDWLLPFLNSPVKHHEKFRKACAPSECAAARSPPNPSPSPGRDERLKESPCAKVIADAEEANARNGHENLGFLSYRAGFMPLHQPLASFPSAFCAWDELVQSMPELIKTQSLQSAVQKLPVLSADAQSLPDRYLHRAAAFFAIVSHAYIRLDGDAPLELVGSGGQRATYDIPAALEKPWFQVSHRLGRPLPFMSYIDLIVYNWQWKAQSPGSTLADFVLENLRLLVPTVDNREENVFYLTQTELLAQATPLLRDIVRAQTAVQRNDLALLKSALRDMTSTISFLGRTTLAKVTSRPSASTFTDPVVWTKSVASLAIPLRKDVRGPTGTGSPFFHMMDEFITRSGYHGHLGKESLELRSNYPSHWKTFLVAVGQISVESFIKEKGDGESHQLWSTLRDKYQGQFGILGLHRRKVFAYLSTAFRIGRSTTIGGFRGKPSEEPWVKVHKELETARQERAKFPVPEVSDADETSFPSSASTSYRTIAISELISHATPGNACWFSAQGKVYDVTPYRDLHPGGDKIILFSCGRDVTFDLGVVQHFSTPSIRSRLEKFAIGSLQLRVFPANTSLQETYDFLVALGYKTAESQNTWTNDMTFLHSKMTRVDPDGVMTRQKARYFQRAWKSLRSVYAPALASHADAVLASLAALHDGSAPQHLTRLSAQLKAITDQEFGRPAFDVDIGTLTMKQAVQMDKFVSASFNRSLDSAVAALRVVESLQSSADSQRTLQPALIQALRSFTAELEDLGTYGEGSLTTNA